MKRILSKKWNIKEKTNFIFQKFKDQKKIEKQGENNIQYKHKKRTKKFLLTLKKPKKLEK